MMELKATPGFSLCLKGAAIWSLLNATQILMIRVQTQFMTLQSQNT